MQLQAHVWNRLSYCFPIHVHFKWACSYTLRSAFLCQSLHSLKLGPNPLLHYWWSPTHIIDSVPQIFLYSLVVWAKTLHNAREELESSEESEKICTQQEGKQHGERSVTENAGGTIQCSPCLADFLPSTVFFCSSSTHWTRTSATPCTGPRFRVQLRSQTASWCKMLSFKFLR